MELLRAYDDYDGKLDVHELALFATSAVPLPPPGGGAAAGGGGLPGGAGGGAPVDRGARVRRAARAAGRDRMQQEAAICTSRAHRAPAYDMGGSLTLRHGQRQVADVASSFDLNEVGELIPARCRR